MRERLYTYSQILQLNTETLLGFKVAPDGLIRALQLFFVVTLVAGLGLWLGIPVQLERPVLYEALDSAQVTIGNLATSADPFLEQNLPFLEDPGRVAEPLGEAAEAAAETINELLLAAETEAELVSPPLGQRTSRVIRVFGQWLSVPLAIMGDWFLLALVAMLVAKLVGGRATLSQHLTAVLLASAPFVLLLPSFIPNLSSVIPITFALGINLFSRLIALVAFAWAALILVKGLSLAHEFSWARAAGVLILSGLALYVLLPLAGILISGYILPR